MKNLTIKIITPAAVFLAPLLASAQLVPCDNCSFDQIWDLLRNIVEFVLILSIPAAAIALAIGGFFMVANMGNKGKVETGKKILTNAIIGIVIAFSAWLIVRTILTALGSGAVSGIL